MSQRRRLPNSLRWRAVGWMEMGLSQADAARRLNVSRSVLFRHEGEEPLLCRSSLQTTFKHQEEESPLLRCEIVFTMQVCMQEDQLCAFLNGRQRRNRLCWAREHVSWTQQQWGSVLFTDESRFTMESDSGRLLIWREQRTRYHQSNTVEKHSYRGGGILVWAGSRSVATLTCMCSMEEP
ncbi:HTH_Tnp_Tc3_2 domain-containing protein [Trichonephila clavipes]|nr:HTH_Tnp_Tc3_2 domain-containing protein [Trichonephila clavipes]